MLVQVQQRVKFRFNIIYNLYLLKKKIKESPKSIKYIRVKEIDLCKKQ